MQNNVFILSQSAQSSPWQALERRLSDLIPILPPPPTSARFPTWCLFTPMPISEDPTPFSHSCRPRFPFRLGFHAMGLTGVGAIAEFIDRWYLGALIC